MVESWPTDSTDAIIIFVPGTNEYHPLAVVI